MAEPIVNAAAERAVESVLELVRRHVGYFCNYKDNVTVLHNKVRSLQSDISHVQHLVEEAEDSALEIEPGARDWLDYSKGKITEKEQFLDDGVHKKTGCSIGFFPKNLYLRYRLGRKAKKMAQEISNDEFLNKRFENFAHRGRPSMLGAIANIGYVSFESRDKIMEEIMKAMEDSTVGMIVVHGPGGVGKSTLANEVAAQALKKELFNAVVKAEVTSKPDIRKIQAQIADMLGMRLEEESVTGRAGRIRKALKNKDKKTLVILDDLWEDVDLNKLGIPFDEDNDDSSQMPFKMMKTGKEVSDYKGCKILLTSRKRNVLSNQMAANIKNKLPFSVGLLAKKEAEMLFKKVARIIEINSEFDPVLAKILEKCQGLPMAIITAAKALTNVEYIEWHDAVVKLERQALTGIDKSVEFSLRLSFDQLESEELKSTFLLCAQMGYRPLVMDLVKYCIGLGILQGVHTIEEARNRVDTLIQKLKSYSLLLDNDSNDYFNVHDVVRDVALSIAYRERNIFTVRNGKLDRWPDKDELERFTTISLHNCDIIDELPEGLNLSRLKVFHIDSDDPSMVIPDNLFEVMKNLRVLILTGVHLPSLPSSIKGLTNLRILCLEQCKLGDKLSNIGELKKLRILSLSGSEVEILPSELGQLNKLQLCDISNCSKLSVIPSCVFSSLTSLEELYMRNSSIQWKEVEGEIEQGKNAGLVELTLLHQLKTLDIRIPKAVILPSNLFFDKLNNYKIVIGDFETLSVGDFKMPDKYESSRTLALRLEKGTNIHSLKAIKLLFKRVENLLLGELNDVQNASSDLNLRGFLDLKHLSIVNNSGIKYIVKSIELLPPPHVFQKLESLCLYKLKKMEKLCYNQLTIDTFGNLKIIKIKICGQLKNLFSTFEKGKLLKKLETMEVFECDYLEEIIIGKDEIELPELRYLTLRSLPSFTSFYISHQMPTGELNEITAKNKHAAVTGSLSLFSEQVSMSNLTRLELSSVSINKIWSYTPSANFCVTNLKILMVKDCGYLKHLLSISLARHMVNLEYLLVSECELLEEIFITEGISMDEKVCIFPKLGKLEIARMERLKTIWHDQVSRDSFGSLKSVTIEECDKLVTIFPQHMVGKFKNLERLKVVNSKSVEELFDLKDIDSQTDAGGNGPMLQYLEISKLPNLTHVWNRDPKGFLSFKHLRALVAISCENLKYLFPASVAEDLKNLEGLMIWRCDGMEEIVSSDTGSETSTIPFVFPKLREMLLCELPKFKSFYNGRLTLEWPALKHLTVDDCGNLYAFSTESPNPGGQPVFLPKKVISSLEFVSLGPKETKLLEQFIDDHPLHGLNELTLVQYAASTTDTLYRILHRTHNLERLSLYGCFFKELMPLQGFAMQENIGTVVQLKELKIWDQSTLQNIGFENDPVLQRVECLILRECSSLINLSPSTASFTSLTYLEVVECNGLMCLMAPSTAKSLVQLETMKVSKCKVIKAIVNKEEMVKEIAFGKLKTLELVSLQSLTSFCSSKTCYFKFPLLEKLVVSQCPRMNMFTGGNLMAPNLQQVVVDEEEDEGKWHWHGDLNATMRKCFADMVSFEHSQYLKLSDYPELERVWNGKVGLSDDCFRNLKTLVVENCEFLSHFVIPSYLLPYLKNLEELQVRSCKVEVIFDINDKNGETVAKITRLKKLSLHQLNNLKQIWNMDPQEILSYQNLREVSVTKCKNLKSLFPISVAKDLVKLKKLFVILCDALEQIIAKDGATLEGETAEFEFPCLTSLSLGVLPKLKYFLPGPQQLKLPELKEVDVRHCHNLRLFPNEFQEAHAQDDQVGFPIVSDAQVFFNLERLSLTKEDTLMIWHGQFTQNIILHSVKHLQLTCFGGQDHPSHSGPEIFPCGFLPKVPNIEKLTVHYGFFQEIFSSERPQMDDHCAATLLSQLKELELIYLPSLKSIGLEHSWAQPILENLKTLHVHLSCTLRNLVPSTVSFSNLMELTVSECDGLVSLLSSSTARSLGLLKEIYVSRCEEMQIIVSEEENNESDDGEIVFGQLRDFRLEKLTRLKSFYDGSSTLSFPSLKRAHIVECHNMKIFSQANVSSPNLLGIDFDSQHQARFRLGVDFNTILRDEMGPQMKNFSKGDIFAPNQVLGKLAQTVLGKIKVW